MTIFNYDDKFSTIYSICPYTSKWLNEAQDLKNISIFFIHFIKFDSINSRENMDIYHGYSW